MARLFGTDGMRGLANVAPIVPEIAMGLGRAAAQVLAPTEAETKPFVVLGRDPRLSGTMLEGALVAGLCSAGVDVMCVGVLPTPGVAYLTRTLGAMAGVMISASHNPYMDNGIKFFSADGRKLTDDLEDALVARLDCLETPARPTGASVGQAIGEAALTQRYIDFLAATYAHETPCALRIALDCAHGAAAAVAPRLFEQLGAGVSVYHAAPDGTNINAQCGALHPAFLQQKVVEEGLDLGFAFDGDADRLIAVDHTGQVLDGDYILAVSAQALQDRGALAHNKVVTTVMANLGLDKALAAMGIELHKTPVGDKYVMQAMHEQGAVLGGEQSGHIIFLDHHATGDGLLSAVQLLNAVVGRQVPLADLARILCKFPQVLMNVRLSERRDPLLHDEVQAAIQAAEACLGHDGRVLVRLSGTEPMARVMLEGPDQATIEPLAQQIVRAIAAATAPAASHRARRP